MGHMDTMVNLMLEDDYKLEHLRPDEAYIPRWSAQSAAFRASVRAELDVPYGNGQRDRLDFFPAKDAANAPTLVFIHGGWWLKGDKSIYSFLAEPFLKRGVSFVAINYGLCPGQRIGETVQQVRRAVTWIDRHIEDLGGNRDRMVLAGHSAGGHLAGMMATSVPEEKLGFAHDLLKGALLLSGLFNLKPIMQLEINDHLRIDAQEVRNMSPSERSLYVSGSVLVACGEEEPAGFKVQSDVFVEAQRQHPLQLQRVRTLGNHFDIIDELADRDSYLFQEAMQVLLT